MNQLFNKAKPHLIALAIFLALTMAYFSPMLSGKVLQQGDLVQGKGMSYQLRQSREQTGIEPLWNSALFSGMPAFHAGTRYPSNLMHYAMDPFILFLKGPMALFIGLFIGYYILLLSLGIDYRLSIIGSIAFGLSSFFLISIEAGHASKVRAIGLMAPVLAGIIMTYRGKGLWGIAITLLSVAFMLAANHIQITYYLFLLIIIFVIIEMIFALKQKNINQLIKPSLLLVAVAILAIGPSFANLWSTYEYSKETIRGGKSELTAKKESTSGGLDKDYATRWSYGKMETFTLLIPEFYGGGSSGELSKKSALYKAFTQNGVDKNQAKQIIKHVPLYWGEQPFTSGPTYFGAIICFLFVLGLFLVKGKFRTWIIVGTILSVVLAWGKHSFGIYNLFFEYMPMFNKFRTPAMFLTLAALTTPLLGIYVVDKILKEEFTGNDIKAALLKSLYITGGITLFFALLGGSFFDFTGASDAQLQEQGWPVNALKEDRASMLQMSAFRSLFFILAAFGIFWYYLKGKIKQQHLILSLGILILADLWMVDKNYLNNDKFKSKKDYKQVFQASPIDQQILQDPDPNYRVLNLTTNTFNEAMTSYHHKSVGGYHPAKLIRYQDLIENQISKNNMSVLNMLNTKYFIVRDKQNKPLLQQNPNALGNAWFVQNIQVEANADEEMAALTNFNPKVTAVIDQRYNNYLEGFTPSKDSLANIKLTHYEPNDLIYESTANSERFAVFSEIYYEGLGKDWQVFIDDKESEHIRVNYTLRGMRIPAGKHKIEFKFHPPTYFIGEKVSLVSSILIIGFFSFMAFLQIKKHITKSKEEEPVE